MISREEFGEDVKIGDVIKISTKTENVVGKVERIGETSVKITRLDSEKPKTISYSDIIGCDFDINPIWKESIDLNKFYESENQEYRDIKPTYGLLTYVNFDQNLAYISHTFITKGGEYDRRETIRFSPLLFKLDMVDTLKFCYLVRYISRKQIDKIEIDESYPIEFLQQIERKHIVKAMLDIDELNVEKNNQEKIIVDFQAIALPRLVINVPALVKGESFFYLKDSGIYSVANCDYVEDEILYTSDGIAINLNQQNIYRFATISEFDEKFQYGCLNEKIYVPFSLIDEKAYNILKTAGQSMFLCYSSSNNKVSRIERIPSELNSQLVWLKGTVTDTNITSKERSFMIDGSVKHLLSVLSDGIVNKKVREVSFKGTELYYKKVACPNWNNNEISDFAIEVRCTSESAKIEYDSVRDKYIAYRNNTFFYEINGSEEELKRLCGDQTTVYFKTTEDLHYLQAFVNSGEKTAFLSHFFGRGYEAFLGKYLYELENQKPNNSMSNNIHEQINKIVQEEVYTNNFYDEYTCLHIQLLRNRENTPRALYRLFLSDFGEKSDITKEISNENDEQKNYNDEIKLLFEKIPNDNKITSLLRHIIILDENSYGLLSEIIDFKKLQELSEKLYKVAQDIDSMTLLPANDIQRCFELLRDIYRRDKERYISQLKGIENSAIGDTIPILKDINERFVRFCSINDRKKLEIMKNLCDKIDAITDDTPYSKQLDIFILTYNNAKKNTEHNTIEFDDLFISTGVLNKLINDIAQLRRVLCTNKKFWPNIKCVPNDPNIFGDEKELALVIKNQGGGQEAKNIKIHFDSSNLTSDCYQQDALKVTRSQNGKTQEIKFNVNLTDWQNDIFELWGTLEYDHTVGYNDEEGKLILSTKKENINIKFQKNSEHSKIKKEVVKNPYKIPAHGGVLSKGDKMFYGRKEEIDEIWEFISLNEQTLCNKKTIILYGQQKCGKTSLVNQIIQKICKNEQIKDSTIIVSLAGVVSSQTDPKELENFKSSFYDKFFNEFEMEINNSHKDVLDLLHNNNLNIPTDIISNSENMAEKMFNNFIDKFNQIDGGKHKILLIMDEFTSLCANIDQHIKEHPEYQGILSFVKQMSEKGLVQIIIGHEAMIRILSRLGFINETVDFSKTIELSALKKEDAIDLIKNPMKEAFGMDVYDSPLGEECIDYLLDLSGSSPWILMKICNYVFGEYRKSSDSKIILSKLKEWVENFIKTLQAKDFDFILKERGKYGNYEDTDTYKYLKSFAENCNNFSEFYRFNGSDVFDSAKNDQIKNDLIARHVLTNIDGKIRINVGLFTVYLRRINGFGGEGD